jgi:ribosomal protein L35
MKTRKSIKKRFKFTKTGKILKRTTGQDHYRSKMTGEKKRKGRKMVLLSSVESKKVKKLLK